MNQKFYGILILIVFWYGCKTEKTKVDLIVYNGVVHTVDSLKPEAESFAVKEGKIVAVGTSDRITSHFEADQKLDAQGQTIVPGLIDAHCHFYNLGLQLQQVDLVGTQSFEEVIARVVDFQERKKSEFIVGRGWDQNDWEVKEFPVHDTLSQLFPDTPVALTRIDGHAMLVNQKAMELANITAQTKVEGGEIILEKGKPTGILIDNPMEFIESIIPSPNQRQQIDALTEAEKINFSYGLTTVDDAGLSPAVIRLIDSLQKSEKLIIKVYAMVSNTPEFVDEYLEKGIYKTDKLNVRSFKIYADGALGSRGAVLKKPYSDKENHYGAMVIGVKRFKELAQRLSESGFQMNTHAIGDSANAVVLQTYREALGAQKDRRWRVEHAQVMSQTDIASLTSNMMMSVQPTHATSDMYWAKDRLGERVHGAYAYQDLLQKTGKLALGTDYPVEKVNPFLTFYAAVVRKDTQGYPEGGFQTENALTREQALKGMTIWAAYSNFEEDEKGSISVGKAADFVILDKDIMTVPDDELPTLQVEATYCNGEKVYGKP